MRWPDCAIKCIHTPSFTVPYCLRTFGSPCTGKTVACRCAKSGISARVAKCWQTGYYRPPFTPFIPPEWRQTSKPPSTLVRRLTTGCSRYSCPVIGVSRNLAGRAPITRSSDVIRSCSASSIVIEWSTICAVTGADDGDIKLSSRSR
eukprot:SAG31_NODE_642_length_13301_cov_14.143084_11_plen_147_part_00